MSRAGSTLRDSLAEFDAPEAIDDNAMYRVSEPWVRDPSGMNRSRRISVVLGSKAREIVQQQQPPSVGHTDGLQEFDAPAAAPVGRSALRDSLAEFDQPQVPGTAGYIDLLPAGQINGSYEFGNADMSMVSRPTGPDRTLAQSDLLNPGNFPGGRVPQLSDSASPLAMPTGGITEGGPRPNAFIRNVAIPVRSALETGLSETEKKINWATGGGGGTPIVDWAMGNEAHRHGRAVVAAGQTGPVAKIAGGAAGMAAGAADPTTWPFMLLAGPAGEELGAAVAPAIKAFVRDAAEKVGPKIADWIGRRMLGAAKGAAEGATFGGGMQAVQTPTDPGAIFEAAKGGATVGAIAHGLSGARGASSLVEQAALAEGRRAMSDVQQAAGEGRVSGRPEEGVQGSPPAPEAQPSEATPPQWNWMDGLSTKELRALARDNAVRVRDRGERGEVEAAIREKVAAASGKSTPAASNLKERVAQEVARATERLRSGAAQAQAVEPGQNKAEPQAPPQPQGVSDVQGEQRQEVNVQRQSIVPGQGQGQPELPQPEGGRAAEGVPAGQDVLTKTAGKPGASAPSERGAGPAINDQGAKAEPPATASPQTGRTVSRDPASLSFVDLQAAARAAGVPTDVGRAEMVRQLKETTDAKHQQSATRPDGAVQHVEGTGQGTGEVPADQGDQGLPARGQGAQLPEQVPQPSEGAQGRVEQDRGYLRPVADIGSGGVEGTPGYVQKDAMRLLQAADRNDIAEIQGVLDRHKSQLSKGDVQGGPKQVKQADQSRKRIATAAMHLLDELRGAKEPRKPSTMSQSALVAELEAGGVEVPAGDKTPRNELVSGVEELRAMPAEAPAEPAKGKEPWEMTKEAHRAADDRLAAATQQRDKAMGSVGGGDRWGEARRFQGKAAGNRVAASDAAQAAWGKAFERADAAHRSAVESAIAAGKPVPAEVLAEYPDLAKKAEPQGAKRPDGRLMPKVGDEVWQQVAGFGGTPAYVYGEVYAAKGGALRVRTTDSRSLVGSAQTGRTYPADANWTVKGDPEMQRREDAAVARAAAEKAADAKRTADRNAEISGAREAAITGGHKPVTNETPVGAVLNQHTEGGKKVYLAEKADKWIVVHDPETGREYTGGYADATDTGERVDMSAVQRSNAVDDAKKLSDGDIKEMLARVVDKPPNPKAGPWDERYADLVREEAARRGIAIEAPKAQASISADDGRRLEFLNKLGKQKRRLLNVENEYRTLLRKRNTEEEAQPARTAEAEPESSNDADTQRQIKDIKAKRSKTYADEIRLRILEAKLAADPSKWSAGDGVGYYAGPATLKALGSQVNRGFRVVEIDAAKKEALIRQIADTGLTTTGGNSDRIGDQWVGLEMLVRDRKYDKAKAPETPPPDAAREQEKIRTYGYDRVEMGRNLTMEQLVSLQQQVTADPASKNPLRASGQSIYLYSKQAKKKLDNIAWAITHKLQEKKGAEAEATAAPGPRTTASIDDLDARTASAAFSNTSHVPEQRGEQYRRDYVATFDRVRDALEPLAKTPEQTSALAAQLERFRQGLIQKYRAFFASHANVASPMVTGPARFPVDRNAKRMRAADARRAEIDEFTKRAESAIRRELFPEEAVSVSSDLPNAPDILRKQIEDAEKYHAAMLETNRIVRDKSLTYEQRREKVAALGLGDRKVAEVLKPDYMGRTGFPDYSLQNNRANIRRMQDRVGTIETSRAKEAREATFEGGKVVENKDANRVQILYDAKPDEATRSKLKSRGFRWSPSEGAWQRQANEAGWRVALELTDAIEPRGNHPELPELPQKSLDIINSAIDARDIRTLLGPTWALGPANKKMRAHFEERTGVKLPASMKGTREAVEGWVKKGEEKPAPIEDKLGDRYEEIKREASQATDKWVHLALVDKARLLADAVDRAGRTDLLTATRELPRLLEEENARRFKVRTIASGEATSKEPTNEPAAEPAQSEPAQPQDAAGPAGEPRGEQQGPTGASESKLPPGTAKLHIEGLAPLDPSKFDPTNEVDAKKILAAYQSYMASEQTQALDPAHAALAGQAFARIAKPVALPEGYHEIPTPKPPAEQFSVADSLRRSKTSLYALPGQEKAMQDFAAKASKVKPDALYTKAEYARMSGASTPSVKYPAGNPAKPVKAVKDFAGRVQSVAAARSTETSRYAVNGVYAEKPGRTQRIVTTDGRRMFILELRDKSEFVGPGIYGVAENPVIEGGKGKLTKTQEGNFPPYQDVIPEHANTDPPDATVDALRSLKTVRRAAMLTGDDKISVAMVLNKDGTLGFAQLTPGRGASMVNVYDGYRYIGHFDPSFLADAFEFAAANGDERVNLHWETPKKPLTMTGETKATRSLTMPVNADYTVEEARSAADSLPLSDVAGNLKRINSLAEHAPDRLGNSLLQIANDPELAKQYLAAPTIDPRVSTKLSAMVKEEAALAERKRVAVEERATAGLYDRHEKLIRDMQMSTFGDPDTMAKGAEWIRNRLASEPDQTIRDLRRVQPLKPGMAPLEPFISAEFNKRDLGGITGAIASKAGSIADAAAERIRKRQIPRGGRTGSGTILEDTIDTGIMVAARAVEFGAKRAKRLERITRKLLQEMGRPDLEGRIPDILRVARRILRNSRDETGAFHNDPFERAIADAQARKLGNEPTPKQAIAESTGAGRKEPKTLTESEAYARSLRREDKAAKKSYRLGLAEGRNRADVLVEQIKAEGWATAMRGALTERAKGEAEVAKLKQQDELRQEALTLAQNHVPADARGQLLNVINQATTPGRLLVAVRRIQHAIADRQMKVGYNDFRAASKGANPAKMLNDYRIAVRQAIAVARRLKKGSNAANLTLAEKQSIADEFNELRKVVVEARHRQKADNELTVQGRIAKRETVVAEGVDAIRARKEIPAAEGLPTARQASIIGRAHQSILTPDSVGAVFRDQTLHTILSEDMWDGETKVHGDTQRGMDDLKANVESAGFAWGSDELQRLSRAASGREAREVDVHLSSGQTIKATPGELMALYATLTDSGAGKNIRGGAGITFDRDRLGTGIEPAAGDTSEQRSYKIGPGEELKIKLALDQINPKLVPMIDRAKAYIEANVRPGLFEAFREQKGYDLEPVENYWRTRRNRQNQDAPGLIEPMRKHMNRALENLGFLKERAPEVKTPYLVGDFFQDFHDIVYQGAVVTHMTRRVRNAELIFKDKRMQEVIQSRFGQGMLRRLDQIIENGKLIFTEPRSGAERTAAILNRNMAKALLTVNPRTYVKQIGGALKLMGVMDVADVAAGAKDAYSAQVSAILKDSPYFRNRYQEAIFRRMTPSLGERGAILGRSRLKDSVKRLASRHVYGAIQDLTDRIELLNNFDAFSARTAIAAGLRDGRRRGLSGPELDHYAATQAEYAIRRTNNTSSQLDMSGMANDLRGTIGSSLLMFTSDSNKSYNMLASARQQGGKAYAKAATAVALDAAWGAAVTTLLGSAGIAAVARLVSGRDKTDSEEKRAGIGETFARAFARNAAGIVYFGDSAVDAIGRGVDKMMGRYTADHPVFETPVASVMEDLASGIGLAVAAAGEVGDEYASGPKEGESKAANDAKKSAEQIAESLSKLAGLPVAPLYRIGKNILKSVAE